MPVFRNPWVILLAALALPPLGLALLLAKPGPGWLKKIASVIAIVILGIAHLFLFYGLRVEQTGDNKPIFSFHRPDSHYRAIERTRTQVVATRAPVTEPKPAVPAIPDTAPAKSEPSPAQDLVSWTDFRGPRRDGVYAGKAIGTGWPTGGPPLLWKLPIGGGYASFVASGGRAFTIEQRRDQEVVAAYDIATGREVWSNGWKGEFKEWMGGDGPRATPTYHQGRVYAVGAEGEFRAIDAAGGKTIWRRNLVEDNGGPNLQWGHSASPLVTGGLVIAPSANRVAAYRIDTGEPAWHALSEKQAYASPVLVTLAGRPQVLVQTATRIAALEPATGKLLWSHPWATAYDVNAAQPIIVSANRFFLSSGYDHGAALIEVSPGGETRTVWENKSMKNKFNSSVLHEGHVYGLDEGILACVNVETGERKWKGGRYGYGQLLLAGGHLIILTETGEVVLVKASPDKHEELARFEALSGKTWNYPILDDGRLLVRNATEMACYRLD
ncbi:MAG: PQQ-binding-like beta-propeller repeat protein [Bryobacteraceae bacterium]|nr:PQQ-binding-like beta-propeller repeat protein [Bryobacteraceae bacterium]